MKKLTLSLLVLFVGTTLFAQTSFATKASDPKAKVTADAKKGIYTVDVTVAAKGTFTLTLTPDAATLKAIQGAKTSITINAKDLGSAFADYDIVVIAAGKPSAPTSVKFGKAGSPVVLDFAKLKIAAKDVTEIQVSTNAKVWEKGGAVKFELSGVVIK